jgi:hydrogenase/urease accessory protein HupE
MAQKEAAVISRCNILEEEKMNRLKKLVKPEQLTDLIALACLVLVFVIVAAVSALAHDPGLSAADLKIDNRKLTAQLTFSTQEIALLVPMDGNNDGQISVEEFNGARSQLEAFAREAISISVDGILLTPIEIKPVYGESNALHFNLNYVIKTAGQLKFSSTLLPRLARGHRQYLKIQDATGQTRAERLLDLNQNSYQADLYSLTSGSDGPHSFGGFFKLGIEHILTGFDHLAFLLALLITGGSLREAAKIITAFTFAHSITLALATLNIVSLPSSIVEPLIAVSIIYVGFENILITGGRKQINKRWLLTFAFGLIHGFGFATVLREMGIGANGNAIAPLFSFNLGVETGQLAIAAITLPIIWKMKQRPSFALRYAPACSILVALAGGYWLIERTLLK